VGYAGGLHDGAGDLKAALLFGEGAFGVEAAGAKFGIAEEKVADADINEAIHVVDFHFVEAAFGEPAVEFGAGEITDGVGERGEKLVGGESVIVADAVEEVDLPGDFLALRGGERWIGEGAIISGGGGGKIALVAEGVGGSEDGFEVWLGLEGEAGQEGEETDYARAMRHGYKINARHGGFEEIREALGRLEQEVSD